MVYLPLEELLPQAEYSVYKLVVISSQRALEIANGAAKMLEAPITEKVATTSLREVQAGLVALKPSSKKKS